MFAKSLLVSLVLAVASVHADSLYISTPSELKQVSSPILCCPRRRTPVPPSPPFSARSYKELVVDGMITV